ncbi:phosphoglucomutase (alpha-D-glucose-1,6-bisphosphate-dependent) [Shewanella maritima]|uniref:phosphoglucomutase (alpha-D-glucose-1,6-bisphosphate-dependent) n=1 Tax=Shewanella maritima TaxID=2520507 RepID=UPI0037357F86
MAVHDRAGQHATQHDLVNIPQLMSHYYRLIPNIQNQAQAVSFGTSGHRGSALASSFNQHHIWAITQAVVDYRQQANITGPMIVGFDTHALSYAAYLSVVEVLTANQVKVIVQKDEGFTPTPVVSQAIVVANKGKVDNLTDGLIITPSHNPPQDGGIKYNPPHGGPADTDITNQIQATANQYLAEQLSGIKKVNYDVVKQTKWLDEQNLIQPYVDALANVIDFEAIAKAGIKIGVDPLGGSGIHYWDVIRNTYNIDISLVNNNVDPTFGFMTLDKDGKIRMDCSSPYAMAGLLAHCQDYDLCLGNDPDYDRHGIVCPESGLMNPNHFLAVAIEYLCEHRPQWSKDLAIGKTLVSSAMIDKVCHRLGRQCIEVPVGFKWFVEGLANSEIAFGGEESAGACFLQKDGSTWCTDKDGFILALLAAEILAVTGKTPAQHYQRLTQEFGESFYTRIDSPISMNKKQKFAKLTEASFTQSTLAGDGIKSIMSTAPGNNAAIGGIKVTTENGWFAARPSGTEALFKLYAESFVSQAHLDLMIQDAKAMIDAALKSN